MTYHAFHGTGGRCWTKARTTEAVPSGRSATCASAPVVELVHLLAHDVALVPDAAPEELGVLEHGVEHEAEAGPLRPAGELGHQPLPARRLGPQHVMGARRGAQRRRLIAHLVAQPFRPGRVRKASNTPSRCLSELMSDSR